MSQYSGIVNFVNEQKNVAIVTQDEILAAYPTSAIIGIGNGVQSQFFGELLPRVNYAALAFTNNGTAVAAHSSSTGVITGADVGTGINSLNVNTGAVALKFTGAAGTVSKLVGTVDTTASSTGYLDLSQGPYSLTLVIDGKTYFNIVFSNDSPSKPEDLIERINTVVGYNVATTSSGHIILTSTTAKVGQNIVCTGDFATLTGLTGAASSSTNPTGKVPAVNAIILASATSDYSNATSEVHTLVKGDFASASVGDKIYFDYVYTTDPNTDSKEIVIA